VTVTAAVLAVAVLLLVPPPLAAQTPGEPILYEMIWESRGATTPFEAPWSLSGNSMAILKPLPPSERDRQPRATHRLVFLWRGEAHGGPLPTDDDTFLVPTPPGEPQADCGQHCRGTLEITDDGERFTAWYARGPLEFRATGHRVRVTPERQPPQWLLPGL
jgi:hypothetical protein